MNVSDVDTLVQEYLSRLDAALRGLPTSRRQQLLAEIGQHVDDSRSRLPEQSEAAIRDLLDRVGQPEEIAAEAMAGEEPRRHHQNVRLIAGLVALVVAAAVAIPLALTTGGSSGKAPATPPTTSYSPPAATLVQLPDVAGQPADTAAQVLHTIGLNVNVTRQSSTIVSAGQVISEAPAAGSHVVIGSTVQLTISTGPPTS
jgi:transcription elongation GreA/GreB family factor